MPITEIIVKKSRFIAYSKKINSEDEAKMFIDEITHKHKRARHVAFAYVFADITKYSDAGEPRGTAGQPIRNNIQKRNLCDVVVVVVRYFGGILLGKSGLIRAYGKSAGASLNETFPVKRKLT